MSNSTFLVESGVTSVFLDLPLLDSAAGLSLTGADSDAAPFSIDFQVGFTITDETDFEFTTDPFSPVGGSIEHEGTVTFNDAITVGDFSIGFDANRVSDSASGFFVADTIEDNGLDILFDLGIPGTLEVSDDELTIADADLLLAPEFASALGLSELTGADVGDARTDADLIEQFTVEAGVTSVFLDLPLLESAAGLSLTGVDSDAAPFSSDFQVGFTITDETDFEFTADPFSPVGGSIEHEGTVTFNDSITVGDFSIGFDADRVSDSASGFFIADTLEGNGLEILFDLGIPGTLETSDDELTIADADLLLAPEFANALGLSELTGADVGDARTDALLTDEAIALDFDGAGLSSGAIVTDQFEGVTFSTLSEFGVMIFDTEMITGGDDDLASDTLGNVLIISEDGDSSDADDAARGGTISVEFDELAVVTQVGLLDIEEEGGSITFFGADDSVIEIVAIEASENGSIQDLNVTVEGVDRIDITLVGSGAVTGLDFTSGSDDVAIAGLADSSLIG
ncbi:MAG: hypothetical protein AAFR31_07400 [Cyanobacteria bacterium J06627_8]